MKSLIIFPPFAFINTPYTSVPILLGQLKSKNIDATSMDLNLEYVKKMLTQKEIKRALIKAEKFVESFPTEYKNFSSSDKNFTNLELNKRIMIKKKETIDLFLKKNKNKVFNTLKYIEYSKKILKSEEFYSPEQFYKAYKIIYDAMSIIFLPYSPTYIDKAFYSCMNEMYSYSYNDLKRQTFDIQTNPFIEYYENEINNGKFDDYDFIAISIPSNSQLVPAFTLARMLREKGKKICIGGNLITRIPNAFENNIEIFDLYVDYILMGEGEESICELINAIDKNTSLDNVSGLYYIENCILQKNPIKKAKERYKCQFSFDGINLNDYLTPEICLSLQISKGCYWGKCTFCDVFYGKPFFTSYTASETADLIEELIKNYNIKCFQFEDESLSPKFCKEFAQEVLKRNLKITYASYLRLEKGFDFELLSLMKKSGYTRCIWGYESVSTRIMNLINKGIDISKRNDILRTATDVGIWNHVSFIYNLPTETNDEIAKTVNFAIKRKEIIHSYQISPFLFVKHSIIANEAEEKSNYLLQEQTEFYPAYDCDYNNRSRKELKEIEKEILKLIKIYRNGDLVNLFHFPDYLILYCKKHGVEYVHNYKFKNIMQNNISCMNCQHQT